MKIENRNEIELHSPKFDIKIEQNSCYCLYTCSRLRLTRQTLVKSKFFKKVVIDLEQTSNIQHAACTRINVYHHHHAPSHHADGS